MKICNEYIKIKNGKKEQTFSNLILDSYIDLYADSFLKFKKKTLTYCLLKFDTMQEITKESISMEYDTVLETNFFNINETYTEKNIINDYVYKTPVTEMKSIKQFEGHQLTSIGFGEYDFNKEEYVIYAFLDVSEYQIIIQEEQEFNITRRDKITSDLLFFSPFSEVKYPVHLTIRGILETKGWNYDEVYSQLYSVGFGTTYNRIDTEEILINDLDFRKEGTGIIALKGAQNYAKYPDLNLYPNQSLYPGRNIAGLKDLKIPDDESKLYPNYELYPSIGLYPQKGTSKFVIYKFKLWRIIYEGLYSKTEDTGLYYYQSQKINGKGKINITIKYERGKK